MESFEDLLTLAEAAHGHLCAGQILGVRMALLGCRRLDIEEPRGRDRKRLVTFVEIDRCATDAIGVVTGCRLGKRALKFRDWGKMAATFIDIPSDRAIRIAARESSKELARALHPEIDNKNQQQMLAYREMLRCRPLHRRMGPRHPAAQGISRLQRRPPRLRKVRRRHQLRPLRRTRRPAPLPRLRQPGSALLSAALEHRQSRSPPQSIVSSQNQAQSAPARNRLAADTTECKILS